MNKKLPIVLFILSTNVMNSFSDGYYDGYDDDYYDGFIREEHFAGYTLSSLNNLFGDNYNGDGYYFVDDDYEFRNEAEPDYWLHFSKEEIRLGVQVRVVSWETEKIRTVAWLREIDKEWVVFSSLEYDKIFVQF